MTDYGTKTPNTDAGTADNFPLLTLPREIREYIYPHCLVVGRVYPYLETHRSQAETDIIHYDAYNDDTPSIALLLVSKQEAEVFLYKDNTFVMPTAFLTAKFFTYSMATSTRRSWLRSLELDLDPSDLDTEGRKTICGLRLGWHEQFWQIMQDGTNRPTASDFFRLCGKEIHEANKRHLVDVS